ncbi:MAG: hemolysin III family protein [Sulfitobacter sp.]|nr:hemolysin III family protein [Sulfitobacter sp.]
MAHGACYMRLMAYPNSKAETIADGAVHVAGLTLALPAVPLLIWQARENDGAVWATALYGFCLILSLGASALYHLSPAERGRPLLNRVDHAAIYLKIAGTYTPLVTLVGSVFAYGVLSLVWAVALAGALAKMTFWQVNGRGSLALYLALGGFSILLIWPLWHRLGGPALALIVAGGLIYSAGTVIFAHPGMRYQNALWHVVVLAASICFFAAIALSL